MKMRLTLMAVSMVTALGVPAGAWAAKAPSSMPVEKTDREFAASADFRELDVNRDGYVSRAEAMRFSDLAKRFSEFDRDRDGRLSAQELSGWRRPSVATTPTTTKRVVTAAADRPSGARPPASRPRNPVDRSASDPGAGTFRALDINNDGHISRDEAGASGELNRRFTALDKNGDGKLSMPEVTGWRSARESAGDGGVARVSISRP